MAWGAGFDSRDVERNALTRRARSAWLIGGLALLLVMAAIGAWARSQSLVAVPVLSSPSQLIGTVGRIDRIKGTSIPPGDAVPVLEFAAGGRLAARDHCGNHIEGKYRVTGSRVESLDAITSLIGCAPEFSVVSALVNTREARIDGRTLTLLDGAGVVLLEATFTRGTPAPSPTPAVTSTPPWTPAELTPPASPNPPR